MALQRLPCSFGSLGEVLLALVLWGKSAEGCADTQAALWRSPHWKELRPPTNNQHYLPAIHQAAEELRGQHCRGAPARAPLAAPGALGLLPRARGVTGAARTLAGGHGAVRAPSWVSASILRPPGFEGQARLPRWQMLFPRFMPSQVLEPSCCPGLGGVEDRGCSYSR
ncbi:small integral membrane protein 43 isoform X2 [Kogia breviceps]|uniref:small integral membrane protein 43 isoform X2 n=1 Tax=Kogia breviceps TaxID=27615 RepID=UPI0034D18BDA